jgi:hypothetical protein
MFCAHTGKSCVEPILIYLWLCTFKEYWDTEVISNSAQQHTPKAAQEGYAWLHTMCCFANDLFVYGEHCCFLKFVLVSSSVVAVLNDLKWSRLCLNKTDKQQQQTLQERSR